MSAVLSFSLFYLSFTPLWISIIFVDAMSLVKGSTAVWTEIISIASIVVVMLCCLIVLVCIFNSKNRDGVQKYRIAAVREEKSITVEFLLSYILPLFAYDFTLWEGVVLFLVFFITLGVLCIKHNYFCVNIVLELLGYGFYQCDLINEDDVKFTKTVISKKKLNGCISTTIAIRSINNEFSVELSG